MSQDSEQIRAQIEETRSTLSSDVNALTESARPGNVARRQVGKVRGTAQRARDRVMGSAPDLTPARDPPASATRRRPPVRRSRPHRSRSAGRPRATRSRPA